MDREAAQRLRGATRWKAAAALGLALAFTFTTASALADTTGVEGGLAPEVTGPDPADQDAPVVAAGDAGYLVAWRSIFNSHDAVSYAEIRAARVLLDGKLHSADERGVFIGFSDAFSFTDAYLDVAAGPGGYLVAWEHEEKIRVAWVSASSVPPEAVASGSSLLDPTMATQTSPEVAFDSFTMTYLVVWTEVDTLIKLRGARVGVASGVPLSGQPFTLAELSPALQGSAPSPVVACGSASCMVAYSSASGVDAQVYGVRIAPDDTVMAPRLISTAPGSVDLPASGSNSSPAIAFDGTSYVAVWNRAEDLVGYSVRGSRVSEAGEVLDPGGVAIADASTSPSIAARAGQPALVTWRSLPGVGPPGDMFMAARVDTAGVFTVLDPGGVPLDASASIDAPGLSDVALVGPGQGLAVWANDRYEHTRVDIWASVLKESAGALTAAPVSAPLSMNWNAQTGPAVASLVPGAGSFVVWKDTQGTALLEDGVERLMSAIVDSSANQLSSYELVPGAPQKPIAVFAATGMDNILTAWLASDTSDVPDIVVRLNAALVEIDGKPVSTDQINVASFVLSSLSAGERLSGAFDGSAYVLFWSTLSQVRASRVSGAGAVLEEQVSVSGGNEDDLSAGISAAASAYGGSGDFMVLWQAEEGVFYRRVSTVSDAIAVAMEAPTKIADVHMPGAAPYTAIGYGGSDSYLIVWIETNIATSTLFGTRVSKTGKRLDNGFVIGGGKGIWSNPVVVFDGTSYLVFWREGEVTQGAWLSREGVNFTPKSFPLVEPPGPLGPVSAASDGAGKTWLTFSRSHFDGLTTLREPARFDVNRARVRVVVNPCAEVACPQEGECLTPGLCNPGGEVEVPQMRCSSPGVLPDGAPCKGGLCIDGVCIQDLLGGTSSASGGGGGGGGGEAPTAVGEEGCGCEVVVAARSRGVVMALLALGVLACRRRGGGRRRR